MIYFQVCGQAPVDLTEQARADIGDIFAGNVIFGFVLLTSLIVLHLLFLHIPALRRTIVRRCPFGKLELYALIISFQGLLLSSAQMLSMATIKNPTTEDTVCAVAGGVISILPMAFMVWVLWTLAFRVRPSASSWAGPARASWAR